MPGKIFISYRRDDVPGDARGLRDGLAARFGKSSIFMDIDNLLAGQRFDEELGRALQVCDVFLAVIGPRWMEQLAARTASGERDYVREEIAAALARRIVVIPVRVGRESQMPTLPRAAELPDDIRDLVHYQKQDVAHERFGRDIAELTQSIALVRKAVYPRAASGSGGTRWLWAGALAAAVAVIYVAAHVSGVPVPWWPAPAVTVAASKTRPDGGVKAKVEEAERQRVAMLKAEEDRKRAADEAKRRADAEAEAKSKAEEAERQRLAMLKAEEDKKRADAEAKRKAEEEAARRTPPRGETFRDCPDCPEMVVVPAGEFMMGSEEGDHDEKPTHGVTIHAPFAVGKFEVTFAEWDACVNAGECSNQPDDRGWGKDRRPVINVSWNDAKEYVGWLSRKTGKTYRLLTEAEWEYAARGGKGSFRYWWGDRSSRVYANYGNEICCSGLAEGSDNWVNTAPVGQFPANPFGLHDMHGNVWEWVEDCYADNYNGTPTDGSARTNGSCDRRVVRGGSWFSGRLGRRSASRVGFSPSYRNDTHGFRIARTLDR